MNFDCILANPPYAKIGCDITKALINELPDTEISILGTRAMLSKWNEHLALEYVYIECYVLEPPTKCVWVGQMILLGHTGSCKVIKSQVIHAGDATKVEPQPNEIRIPFSEASSGKIYLTAQRALVRNRYTSTIISVSDEDYAWFKEHWDDMNVIERFWWLVDHGFYKRFEIE